MIQFMLSGSAMLKSTDIKEVDVGNAMLKSTHLKEVDVLAENNISERKQCLEIKYQ